MTANCLLILRLILELNDSMDADGFESLPVYILNLYFIAGIPIAVVLYLRSGSINGANFHRVLV